MWWPSIEAMRQTLASPEAIAAVAAIRQDEDGFTDPALTRAFAAKEHSIFDYIEMHPHRDRMRDASEPAVPHQ
jgi:hypothetical protein